MRVKTFKLNMGKSTQPPPPKVEVLPRGIGPVREPNPNDVLCGRGGRINSHEGNVQFREIVNSLKHTYLAKTTKKLEKAHIAAQIVTKIRNMNPPGRFLKEDGSSGMWYDIGDEKARKKAGQALREDAPDIRHEMEEDEKLTDDSDHLSDSKAPSKAAPPRSLHGSPSRETVRATPGTTSAQSGEPFPPHQHSPPPTHQSPPSQPRQRYPPEQQQPYIGSGRGHPPPQRYPQHPSGGGYHRPYATIGETGPSYHDYDVTATSGPPPVHQQQPYPYGHQPQYAPSGSPHAARTGPPPLHPGAHFVRQQQEQAVTTIPSMPTDVPNSVRKTVARAFSPLLSTGQRKQPQESKKQDHRQQSPQHKQVAFGRVFQPPKDPQSSGTSHETLSTVSTISGADQLDIASNAEQRRSFSLSQRAQWQQEHQQKGQQHHLQSSDEVSPVNPHSRGRAPVELKHSVSMGTGEDEYLSHLRISDKSKSSNSRFSQISDLSMSLGLSGSFGLHRSQSFPGLQSGEFMSLGDTSLQALLEEKVIGDINDEPGRTSKSSAESSSTTNKRSGTSSSKSGGFSDFEKPPRIRTQSSTSAAAMSITSVHSHRSSGRSSSHRSSSDSSWLTPYKSMQSISSDMNPWRDDSSRSVMSDISTDLLALDLAADTPTPKHAP